MTRCNCGVCPRCAYLNREAKRRQSSAPLRPAKVRGERQPYRPVTAYKCGDTLVPIDDMPCPVCVPIR